MRSSDKATFIGIGGQKCATTWLYGVLQQCPGVKVSDWKEVDFFSYHFDHGYEWYERSFADAAPRQHRGEVSPSYLVHPLAAPRAASYNPDLHVFVTLRDPVKRAFSNHLHEVRKKHISGDNLCFEAGLENNPFYWEQGLYAKHLRPWFDHFPSERIHVFFQEDISADSEGMASMVSEKLGLSPLENFLDLRENESVRYRNQLVGGTLWKIGDYARRNGLGGFAEVVKKAPGVSHLRNANREPLKEVVESMQPDTEISLTEFYKGDVAALTKLLGRPAPWPRFEK